MRGYRGLFVGPGAAYPAEKRRSKAAAPGERRMKRSVVALTFLAAAGPFPAVAQSAVAQPALTATQLTGRNLFAQHCVVCHVKTLITAVRTYGPALSKESLGGQDDVLRELIGNGTPNMPGFKYSLEPGEIGTIIAYLKTLPTQPPAAPASPAPRAADRGDKLEE
jgi:mono/diheme cytochrome c family protein